MSNFDTAREALEVSANSAGSAMQEHAKWSESLEARLLKLKASWQSFAQSFMNSSFLKSGISLLSGLLNILDKLINNFGLLGTVGLGAVGFGIFKHFKKAADDIEDVVDATSNLVSASSEVVEASSNVASASTEATESMSNMASVSTESAEAISNVTSASTEVVESASNITSATTEMTEATSNMASSTTEAIEASTNLASANTELAESTANVVSSVTETAESMTNVTSATTETIESMSNMTSASTEAAEATANIASGASEFVEAAGNVASASTGAAEAIVDVGAGAGKASKGLKAFFGTFAGKVTIIGAVVAAIGLAINAYKNYKQAQAEARQETIETSNTFLNAAGSFEQAYIKYSGRTNLTSEEEAELESAIKGTVDALGDKSSALQSAVNSSNDYLKSLEAIKNAELEAANTAAKEKRDAARKDLEEAAIGWTSADGSEVNVKVAYGASPDSEETAKIAKKVGEKYYTTLNSTRNSKTMGFELPDVSNVNDIIEYYHMLKEYQEELSDAGLSDTSAYDNVTSAIEKMTEAVDAYTSGAYEAAKAQYQLDNGIPKTVDEYLKMREAILKSDDIKNLSFDTKQIIANTLDKEYGQAFDLSSAEVQARRFVGIIESYNSGYKGLAGGVGSDSVNNTDDVGTVETFINVRTAVNNNECTVGQYMSELDKVNTMMDDWSDKEKNEFNTSLGLDTDTIKQQYDEIYDYLNGKNISALNKYEKNGEFRAEKDNIKDSEIRDFLNGLSVYELQAVVNLKTELDWENDDWDEIEAKVREEAKLIEAISFDIDITDATAKLEKLNTAMSESVSGAGLTSESMTAIEDMFGDLDGYDPSKLFERTATGMRLNSTELSKLNDEFRNTNVDGLENKMDALGERYIQTREELSNLTYGTDEYNQKARDLEAIESQINATEKLIAQYDGLTNAYQEWQRAESAGNQRDMYENVLSGFETVKDELSRGWADDGTVEFLELLTGKTNLASKSGKELKEIWNGLDDTIKHTSYSVKDFFTTDKDGNSTSKGVYNFLDAIGQIEEEAFGGKDVVKRDKDGNVIAFDFKMVGGNEAIAEALGISEELVDIMVRAADDAGFVVSMDGTYQQLDVLKEKAQEAANELKNTFKLTDYEFNLDTTQATGEGSIAEQYQKASDIWEKFKNNKNADGTIDMNVEGAEEAFTLISTLQSMIDKASEPIYMELDASEVEKDIQTPLSKLQEYETLAQQEHQLQLKGTDTSEIDKAQKEIVDYFEGLDEETKIKLGIEGLSKEEIEAKIEKGEIEIPASVDIQMDMSEDIKDMKLLMMNELGYITDQEVKLKVGYQIDDSLVDTLSDDKKEVVIEFISKNEEWFNKLSEEEKEVTVKLIAENKDWYEELDDDEKEIVVELVSRGVDIETLTNDETKNILVDFATENEDLFNELDDKETKVFVEYVEKNKDVWEELDDDEKEIFVELIASGVDIETLTNDETKEVAINFAIENEDDTNKLEDEEKQVVVDLVTDDKALKALEEHGVEIEAFCNIFGVEKVDDLKERLNGLDDEQILVVAEVLGKIKVDQLKTAMDGLEDEDVKAIANAIGKGDVDALRTAVFNLEDKEIEALAKALGYEDVNGLKGAMDNLTDKDVQAIAQTLGITDVDSLKAAIDRLSDKDVKAVANVDGKDDVTGLKGAIDNLKGKTVTVWAEIKQKASSLWSKLTGGGGVDGTAHVDGTAFVDGTVNSPTVKKSGRAFKQGNWGTKDSGVALGGEEAPELLVRNGRWHLIGEKGAEFFGYRKGDIIFNASQTREIFEKGKITHGNGRGKALVSGTAFSKGTGGGFWENDTTGKTYGKSSSSKSSSSSSSSKEEKEEFEETIDWIETAIDRIERAIDQLDTKANSTYRSWSERNKALSDQISEVGNEIDIQQKAYDEYMKAASGVGLSEAYASKVRNGTIDIETIKDETLKEKIDDYKNWYEKALACKDAILELQEQESKLFAQRFENVQTQYDAILQRYEHTEAMLNEYISQAEEQGYVVSKKYYQALIDNEKQNIAELKREQADLIAARDEAVASGTITRYSEEWYNMCSEVDATTQAIEEGETSLLSYARAMEEIDWSVFDLIQERISAVSEEADFLIELMSNDKLFDDNGKLTSQGIATMGLHGQKYNDYMYQADEYGAEVSKLNAQIAKDPYDQELINRRNELLELQRESILAAEDEKNAIRDMVEEGINLELDALQKRIDLYNEAMDSAKDLYDYQKKVEEQTSEISDLRKQEIAYLGDTSEEGKAKLQEIKVSLEEAESDLEETEYDKYISDQAKLLDSLYVEYETILNTRLDNIDYLLEQMIAEINASALGMNTNITTELGNTATTIKTTLETEAKNVGTTLSTAMSNIWTVGDGNIKSVLSTYGKGLQDKQTTTNTELGKIKADIAAMVDDIDKDAKKKTTANKTTTSAKKNPTTSSSSSSNKNNTTTNKTQTNKSSGDGKPKVGDKVKFVSGKYYYDSQGKNPLGSKYQGKEVYITSINTKSWATHPYHISTGSKLGSGDLGWLKLNQISGYATGKKNFLNGEIGWTQENGTEFIVRPSDGAILTPIAKGDSVLNATASKNIWNMANSPVDFIKNNLGLGNTNIPNGSNVNNNYTQNLESVVFNLPNVQNYNELLSQMQKDKNFEKLILSMSVDRLAGKSSLAKNKSIR